MSALGPLILLVEDEPELRRFLKVTLEGHGYRYLEATTAREALVLAASRKPELVLLDLGLPDGDGLEVTLRLREWSSAPIVVISARGRELDKIAALDNGADDYLTKPFGVGELLARIRVALRHASMRALTELPSFAAGDLAIDLTSRRVTVAGGEVHLTPIEYKLLAMLARNAGRVVTHTQLLKDVWGAAAMAQTHYLRVYMGQLRQKIEPEPARPRLLLTEPGVGYRLEVSPRG